MHDVYHTQNQTHLNYETLKSELLSKKYRAVVVAAVRHQATSGSTPIDHTQTQTRHIYENGITYQPLQQYEQR